MRIAVVGTAILAASMASAGIEHTILHGVSVRKVYVWVGPDGIAGLSTEGLKSIAESRLREARIPVDPAGDAVLELVAHVHRTDSGMCFVKFEGSLAEPARLERNGFHVHATSWGRDGTVIAKADECAASVTKIAESALADFVEVYRAMNPVKASGE